MTSPDSPRFDGPGRGPGSASGRREGFALVLTLMVVLLLAVLVTTAVLLGSNHHLLDRLHDRTGMLRSLSEEGLELARARLNADPGLFPETGYSLLETEREVTPGIRRTLYAGPSRTETGERSTFGTILSEVRDGGGGVAILRGEILVESFAHYADFTDRGSPGVRFGEVGRILGPVHANGDIGILASGALFTGPVRTAGRIVEGRDRGTFMRGFREGVPRIEMPGASDFAKLRTEAERGGMFFESGTEGAGDRAALRFEFLAIDLDGNGDVRGEEEGFLRIFRGDGEDDRIRRWVSGIAPEEGFVSEFNANCGGDRGVGWEPLTVHPGPDEAAQTRRLELLAGAASRCGLGGDPSLLPSWDGTFPATGRVGEGEWLRWDGPIHPALSGRPDAPFLFPLSPTLNPEFRGVIYVDGRAAVSGTVRGRVTLVSSENLVLVDDLTHASPPGSGECADVVGLISGADIVVADNTLMAPQADLAGAYRSYGPSPDEFIHAVLLALGSFRVMNHDAGSFEAEPCGTVLRGRGCLVVEGGIIQGERGPVGTAGQSWHPQRGWIPNGSGYLTRYAHDACAATRPPPYFPTTGRFLRGPSSDVDPVRFRPESHFLDAVPESES